MTQLWVYAGATYQSVLLICMHGQFLDGFHPACRGISDKSAAFRLPLFCFGVAGVAHRFYGAKFVASVEQRHFEVDHQLKRREQDKALGAEQSAVI